LLLAAPIVLSAKWPDGDCVTYADWLATKSRTLAFDGVDPDPCDLLPALFPHQRDLVRWALRKGRAAIFADTGLGKSIMQLEWARHVTARGRVLILTPLAVATQTVAEGARFGIACRYLREDDGETQIAVTNYDMLHRFDPSRFIGVVLDESSILKSFAGKTRNAIISAFGRTPYRLACTATPAPNDFTELGNHSEFLGVKSRAEMLAEYFVHDGGSTQSWRVKGHAVRPFWEWVASWGAVVRRPSDLGYDDTGFELPQLNMLEHVVGVDHRDAWSEGYLFAPQVSSLRDARVTRRATMRKRVELARDLVAGDEPALIWCELNDEGDMCERLIEDAVQVRGSDDNGEKIARLNGFASRQHRVLVTKPKIAGFGLNWQHCANIVFLGASYSYEQTYQCIRRCWRFGQTRNVCVHVIRAETEEHVVEAYRRKEADAERLASEMIGQVRDAVRANVVTASAREWNEYTTQRVATPSWLQEG